MYQIDIKKKVSLFVDSLSNSKEIYDKLKELKEFRTGKKLHLDVARLKGKNKNLYRLRIGEIRLIFEILKQESVIYIKLADYRGNIYK